LALETNPVKPAESASWTPETPQLRNFIEYLRPPKGKSPKIAVGAADAPMSKT